MDRVHKSKVNSIMIDDPS